jgi:hypothetical protein
MRTERPTCRECACAAVCEYFHFENGRNLDERCALENWEKYFVPKQEWISVDERLPENYEHCLLFLDNETMEIGCYHETSNKFVVGGLVTLNMVTHWMPLPEAPKMKGGAE